MSDAPFAYAGLDRIMHEKARLSILTSLISHRTGLGFADLKALCGLTDGNLSRHLQILEEAGLVEVIKGYAGKRPTTSAKLTPTGEARFLAYLDELEKVLAAASSATQNNAKPAAGSRFKPA